MPAWQQQFTNASKTNQNIPATTETVVATVVVNDPSAQAFSLYGLVVMTTGAASTSVTLRIRQDSSTGTALNNPTAQQVTAGNTVSLGAVAVSPAGDQAGRTFVLTVTKAGGAAADTVVEAVLVANAS